MSVVLTVMNMKGGVGKTTVAMHVAGAAARYHLNGKGPRRVLGIDYDPQFNMSQSLLDSKTYFALEGGKKTVLSVLQDDVSNLNAYKLTVPGNFDPPKVSDLAYKIFNNKATGGSMDLVPSTLDLMYVALGQATTSVQPIEERFRKFIVEAKGIYDLIVIDCHPAGSLFTKTALMNSDHVVIPVMPKSYSVRGVGLMMKFIEAKKIGTAGPAAHVLINNAPRFGTTPQETSIRSDASYGGLCLTNTLKGMKAFSDPEGGKGFVWSSSAPYSAEARDNIRLVAGELLGRIGA